MKDTGESDLGFLFSLYPVKMRKMLSYICVYTYIHTYTWIYIYINEKGFVSRINYKINIIITVAVLTYLINTISARQNLIWMRNVTGLHKIQAFLSTKTRARALISINNVGRKPREVFWTGPYKVEKSNGQTGRKWTCRVHSKLMCILIGKKSVSKVWPYFFRFC